MRKTVGTFFAINLHFLQSMVTHAMVKVHVKIGNEKIRVNVCGYVIVQITDSFFLICHRMRSAIKQITKILFNRVTVKIPCLSKDRRLWRK